MKNPKITVLMPVYNCSRYIGESINSILNQSFKDFELIIIDDGSTDETFKVIKKIRSKKIKLFKNKHNLGIAKCLNIGLKKARGEFIARCDGDDINFSERFKIQKDFLESRPDYVLVSSNAFLINEQGKNIGKLIFPSSDKAVRRIIFLKNPIIHSAVMYRKKTIKKINGYRELFNLGGEDYDLWFRLMKQGKFRTLPKFLIKRRITENVFTKKFHFRIEVLALLVRVINLPLLLKFLSK